MNIRSLSTVYNFFSNRGLYCYSSVASVDSGLASVKAAKPFIYKYLIERCGLSETEAVRASEKLPNIISPKTPDAVLRFLCEYRFTSAQIRDVVRRKPSILVTDIVPQIKFLRGLDIGREDIVDIVSKRPKLLVSDLDQRLGPGVEFLRKNFSFQDKDVIRILKACKWFFYQDPSVRLLSNIASFKSHGIVGTQLTILMKRNPTLFLTTQAKIIELIKRVTDMGLSTDSRMFVYALLTMRSLSPESLQQKLDTLSAYGLSEEELKLMFQRAPNLFKSSKEKLIRGMNFYLKEIGINKSALVQRPACLMVSIDKRAIPRFRVIQFLKSKKLIKKEPALTSLLSYSDARFVKLFISRFEDAAAELLIAYKGKSASTQPQEANLC